ncbi:MAG: DUF5020 family protein [Marinifilaceae bacterium]
MIKKILLISLIALMSCKVFGQNLQLHWDFLNERNYPTLTFEMYKGDNWGSTFMFIDFDFPDFKDAGTAYMELSRNLKLGNFPLQLHAEYNGGLWSNANGIGGHINNAWLVGASYPFMIGNCIFEVTGTYKHIMRTDKKSNFQLTGVWNIPLFKGFMTFNGFADLWSEQANGRNDKREMVFITEPQLWVNLGKHLSLGTEIEISKNFVADNAFKVYPTLGAKWNF